MRSPIRGFSMLQVVAAFAMLAVFTVMFMRQFNSMSGAQRGLASKNDAIGADVLVRTVLQNGDACRQTFTGMNMDGDWHPIVVKDPAGTVVLEPGSLSASVKVSGIRAKATGASATRFVTLEITMQRPMGTNTIDQKSLNYANVLVDGAGVVLSCAYGSSDVWNLVHQETFKLPFEPRTPPVSKWWLVDIGKIAPPPFGEDFQESIAFNYNCYTSPPSTCTSHTFPNYVLNPRGNVLVLTARSTMMSNWNGLTAAAHVLVSGGSYTDYSLSVGAAQAAGTTVASIPHFFDTVPGTPLNLRSKITAYTWGATPNSSHAFIWAYGVEIHAQHYMKSSP